MLVGVCVYVYMGVCVHGCMYVIFDISYMIYVPEHRVGYIGYVKNRLPVLTLSLSSHPGQIEIAGGGLSVI